MTDLPPLLFEQVSLILPLKQLPEAVVDCGVFHGVLGGSFDVSAPMHLCMHCNYLDTQHAVDWCPFQSTQYEAPYKSLIQEPYGKYSRIREVTLFGQLHRRIMLVEYVGLRKYKFSPSPRAL